jgi:hypothetical protein
MRPFGAWRIVSALTTRHPPRRSLPDISPERLKVRWLSKSWLEHFNRQGIAATGRRLQHALGLGKEPTI